MASSGGASTFSPSTCSVITVPADGACLFSCISYILHSTVHSSRSIRRILVSHVARNWRRFQVYTVTPQGGTFRTVDDYVTTLSAAQTFGTLSELQAAGELYPFRFEVYRNGNLLATFGMPTHPPARLRFTGTDLQAGHFDVLQPQVLCSQTAASPCPQKKRRNPVRVSTRRKRPRHCSDPLSGSGHPSGPHGPCIYARSPLCTTV